MRLLYHDANRLETRLLPAVVLFLMLGLTLNINAQSQPPAPQPTIELIDIRDLPLAEALRVLSQQTDLNLVASAEASDVPISLNLRNVTAMAAIETLARTHNLFYRVDQASGIIRLHTIEEYQRQVTTDRDRKTQVFTLLYPNAVDVATAIRDLYGSRVMMSLGNDGRDDIDELQDRFDRFDLLTSRSEGLGLSTATGGVQVTTAGDFGSTRENINSVDNFQNFQQRRRDLAETRELTEDQIARLEAALRDQPGAEAATVNEAIRQRDATIWVTVVKRHNQVLVRTSDEQTMLEIESLVRQIDVPTPLVLLEVRVLRVDLTDGLDTAFDFAFQAGDAQGSFTRGQIAPPAAGSIIPGGSGANFSAGIFQVVSNNFQARLELLQSKGRVTALATPILLTANNEVSRIFSGEQVPIVVGFTEPQVIVSDGGNISIPASPVTELENVGTNLLITANINADRTVTMRLLQETSEVNQDGARILVQTDTGFSQQSVDTVASQSASGTVVAKDGMLLAFGGLIEEGERDKRDQFPILGDLPLIGFLFRREDSEIARQELIVLIRPYVLSTPVEGSNISRNLLDSLSIHPYKPGAGFKTSKDDDWGVFRDKQPDFDRSLLDMFRYHTTPSQNGDTP